MKGPDQLSKLVLPILFACFSIFGAQAQTNPDLKIPTGIQTEQITFGAGCFWCVEAVFQELKGVYKVESGYSGGNGKKPTYKEVCTGETGYAEVAQITYDPKQISYETLLSIFFTTHDPTTPNRQGRDYGTQYRSAIFYHSLKQKEISERVIKELNSEDAYPHLIVTEVNKFIQFYPAEDYHQNYYSNNGDRGYCSYVIQPKVEKMRKVFKEHLKD